MIEEKRKEEYLSFVHKGLNIVITFGIPCTFLIFLLANPIIVLLAGKSFMNSIFVVQIMAPVILMVAFAQIFVLLILSVHRKDKNMVALSAIGMTISLIINLIFIPDFAEKATAFSQLVGEFTVTLISFFLAKRVININFPTKKFLLNLLLVIPFSVITYTFLNLLHSNLFIIVLSAFFCALYFLFYQFFIIKDKFLTELLELYVFKAKVKFFR
jgi:O-antigen/teichoic acid export membrane protein